MLMLTLLFLGEKWEEKEKKVGGKVITKKMKKQKRVKRRKKKQRGENEKKAEKSKKKEKKQGMRKWTKGFFLI